MKNTNEGLNLEPNHIIIIGSEDTLRHASSLADLIGEDSKQVFEIAFPPVAVWNISDYSSNVNRIVNTQKQIFIGIPSKIENRVSSLKETKPLFNEQGIEIYKRGNRVLIDTSSSQIEESDLKALLELATKYNLSLPLPEEMKKIEAMTNEKGVALEVRKNIEKLCNKEEFSPKDLAFPAAAALAASLALPGTLHILFYQLMKNKKNSANLRFYFAIQIFYSRYLADL